MLCILGPTASGKSSLVMWLATQRRDVEIISLDSAQIYQGMDIGTAKPSLQERAEVPHHLIDILDPAESYSAARFVTDATKAAQEIRARGKVPVVAGGTMLYFKALAEGLDALPSAPAEIREAIHSRAQTDGWPLLHQELARLDPQTARRLDPNDAQRISRALELHAFTGRTMSTLIAESAAQQQRQPIAEPLTVIALQPEDRAWLHQRIAERFQAMLRQGFLEEVRSLQQRGDLHPSLPSMRCVGYRQAWDHLGGLIDHDAFVERAIAATRQLAKRQITWLRSFGNLIRIDPKASMQTARDMCIETISEH